MTFDPRTNRPARLAALFSAVLLLAVWCVVNLPRLAAGQSGVITFLLGSFFGLLLLLRPKTERDESFDMPGWLRGGAAVVGAGSVIAGIVVPVHQLEWLGVLLVFFACLSWALPRRYGRDLLIALFIIYWIHPLPGQVFGPLQLGLQALSVRLSEAVLHVSNVAVWGDGMVLRTGARVFGVPEACSGMKTAIAVLFCALGIGLLMRFRWFVIGALLLAGVLQVLLLNVIRISGIVWVGKDRPPDWNETVLHDTMGIFLLLAVGLIHLDAALLRQFSRYRERKRAIYEAGDEVGEPEEKRRRWPLFWRLVFTWWKPVAVIVLIGLIVVVSARRLRPSRRVELVREVARGMMAHDPEDAERAVRAALRLMPSHDGLHYDLALILVNRGRPGDRETAIALVRRKPIESRSLEERVLEVRALLELKQLKEAEQAIGSFPESAKSLPGVALVLAEFNAAIDRPADVAASVVTAARGVGTQERIRQMFPYLAARDLWDAIRESDSDMPYATAVQGVIAAEARLKGNDVNGAANVLRRAMVGRELEPVFLSSLTRVAKALPRSEWPARFEAVFKANTDRFAVAELTMAMEGSFAMGRPDLGWLAYRRLACVAPDDPMLMIAPAEYGRYWFAFRHEVLGVTPPESEPLMDAKSFFLLARMFSPWKELWREIPLGEELGGVVSQERYERRLRMCLESLQRIKESGKVDFRLSVLHAQVLGELGRWDEAHARLKQYEAGNPHRRRDYLLAHAALYKAQNEPELLYETLAEFLRIETHAPLAVWLDQAGAALVLGAGPYVIGIMDEVRADFPESSEWAMAMAGILGYFGFAEDALFLVDTLGLPVRPAVRVGLLMETGRIVEGQRLAAVEMLSDVRVPKKQTHILAPAERAVEWRGGKFRDEDYGREAAALPERRTPFLRELNRLKSAWYAAKGEKGTSAPAAWEAIGRDVREKALALCELTILLMRQERTKEALVAVRRASELRPSWTLPWRLIVILQKDLGSADKAYRACPRDSEVWLARVVIHAHERKDPQWAANEVGRAITGRVYSAAALVRAGDFLLRQGMTNAASLAARAAIKVGKGLLPAYVLGIQCGIMTQDYTWALACSRDGAEQALEPWPFYKLVVGLKARSGVVDQDVIRALENLAGKYPAENVWAERLGEAYFRQGQTDRAVGILEDALARAKGQKPANVRTYLFAAESARREGDFTKAAGVLRVARALFPDDTDVLNNLVYTLAQAPATVDQAVVLLPELVKMGRGDFAVYDTAAMVYLRAGDLRAAEENMKKALRLVKKGDYAWVEVYLNATETQMKSGQLKEAREYLNMVKKTPGRPAALDARVRDLDGELTRREREQPGWF